MVILLGGGQKILKGGALVEIKVILDFFNGPGSFEYTFLAAVPLYQENIFHSKMWKYLSLMTSH